MLTQAVSRPGLWLGSCLLQFSLLSPRKHPFHFFFRRLFRSLNGAELRILTGAAGAGFGLCFLAGCSSATSTTSTTSAASTPAPPSSSLAFSPAAGSYSSAQLVTLSASTTEAAIYYTTDGTAPSSSSTLYAKPISVNASEMINAVVVDPGGTNSVTGSANYIINPPPGPVIPANATTSTAIQTLGDWIFNHDAGTPGTAAGETSLVNTPSLSGNTREFDSSYTDTGGEIYSAVYASDTNAMNFVYDAQVWIEAGSSIANLEMDSNQVLANGNTVIYAFQCDGYYHVWDYSGAGAKWVRSTQSCDPSTWSTNAWHHVQISYSRDDAGNVTYKSVWLDGNEQAINATVPSSFSLGWKIGVVQTQFQLDGKGASGTSTVYLDKLNISRW
jgi:hypothetical protein